MGQRYQTIVVLWLSSSSAATKGLAMADPRSKDYKVKVIKLLQQRINAIAENHPDCGKIYLLLTLQYERLHQQTSSPMVLKDWELCLQKAANHASSFKQNSLLCQEFDICSISLPLARFRITNALADLDKTIESIQSVCHPIPDPSFHLELRAVLGMIIKLRYGMNKNSHDLDDIISSLEEALRSMSDDVVAIICMNTLGIAYRLRGESSNSKKDITSAVNIHLRVLGLPASAKLNQNELQGNLAVALLRRYDMEGSLRI